MVSRHFWLVKSPFSPLILDDVFTVNAYLFLYLLSEKKEKLRRKLEKASHFLRKLLKQKNLEYRPKIPKPATLDTSKIPIPK